MAGRSIRTLSLFFAAVLCLCEACFATGAIAGDDVWAPLSSTIFEHLGRTNGLPNTLAQVTVEDGDGFLWVGTPSGLARWDGYRFRAYVIEHGDAAMLADNSIQCLHRDEAGRLWAGLNSGGVAFYDRERDRFVIVPLDPTYPDRVVHALADDGAGGLWIGTGDGMDHLPAGASVTRHLSGSPSQAGNPQSQRIMQLLRDRDGVLWVGTAAGLFRFDEQGGYVPVPGPDGKTVLPVISALFEDGDGRLWIGTSTQGAFALDKGAMAPRAVQEGEGSDSPLRTQWVTAIAEVTPGRIWLGTRGQGIVAEEVASGETRRIRRNRAQPTSLQNEEVFGLYRDHSGQIWVSTTTGLDRYNPGQTAISTLFGGDDGANSLSKPDVWSVLAFDDRRIWLGLNDAGLDIVDLAGGRVRTLTPPSRAASHAFAQSMIRSLVKSPDGGVYAATLQGLFHLDGAGAVTRVKVSPDRVDIGVDTLEILNGVLWIGTRNDGLWKLDPHANHAGTRIGAPGLTDDRVLALATAPDGRLWVGTRNGLNLVDPVTDEIEPILPDAGDPQSLSAGLISSLLFDRQGRLWVATEGSGIDLLEGRDAEGRPRFRHFGKAQGLPHLNVDKLLMDKTGKIWASTDDGLASIRPDTFEVQVFGQADGLAIPTYWINSGDVTEQGDLLFGGVGGLTVVHPDRISGWTLTPPIVVTDLRVGGEAVPAGRISGAGAKEAIVIRPEANSLAVEFAALDFSAPERNRYAYKLDGFDDKWIETDAAHRLASYTNLQPGSYLLRLRGSNRDGVWAERSLALAVRVLPAWYQTIWFRIGGAALVIVLVVLLVRSRTAYYRRRQQVLERRVDLRTAELQTRTDQVKALLDHSGQGFLSFDEDLVVDNEYSLACETMLGLVPAGLKADQALFSTEDKKAELFRKAAEAFRDCKDYKRRTVLLSLFPTDIRRGGLMIDAVYRRIGHGRLMAILTDVTESQRLAVKLEANYRRQDMVVAAVIESRDFFAAVESYRHFIDVDLPERLARDEMPDSLLAETYRTVHTFKGVLAQFNFERSPKALHEIEEVLTDFAAAAGSETVEMLQAATDFALLRRSLALDLAVVEELLGSDFIQSGARIALPAAQADEFSQLGARLLGGGAVDPADPADRDLLRELARLNHVGLDRVLHGFDRLVRQLAESQGKLIGPLAVEGAEGVLADPRRYRDFFQSLVHVFRNAVSHGIERPAERIDSGKDKVGTIRCTVARHAGSIVLAIADDGAGLDLDLLRGRLADIGLAADLADEAVMQSVFTDQVSTQEVADKVSGRGMGLGAVRQAVEALGGAARVSSTPMRGAVFEFVLPLDTGLSAAE